MKLHRINGVMLRHFYEARRNLDRVIDMLYWPVLDVIVWGFFTIYLSKSQGFGGGVIGFLLGATILWGIFFAFQRDMTVGFLDELWSKNLLNLFSTPLTVWEYITGLVVANFIKVVLGFLAASLLAWAFYAFNIFLWLPALLPYILNLLFFGLATGIVMTGLIFRYSTKIQTLAWSFAGLLMPVSCVFYPVGILPPVLRNIAWFLPTMHSFEGMRTILAGGSFSPLHFFWGLGLNVVYFILSILFFKAIFEVTKKKGILVKLE